MAWFHSLAAWIEGRGGKRKIMRAFDVGDPELYLERFYILKTPWVEAMIHRFHLSDEEVLHDHPWASCSVILETGYEEFVYENGETKSYFRPAGYIGTRKATDLHRVQLAEGTKGKVWTLFITFKRVRKWGFLTEQGWVPFDQYLKKRGTLSVNEKHETYKGWLFPVRDQ
jgi:hypothetical protein